MLFMQLPQEPRPNDLSHIFPARSSLEEVHYTLSLLQKNLTEANVHKVLPMLREAATKVGREDLFSPSARPAPESLPDEASRLSALTEQLRIDELKDGDRRTILEVLPEDLLITVAKLCDAMSVGRLVQTCSRWRNIAYTSVPPGAWYGWAYMEGVTLKPHEISWDAQLIHLAWDGRVTEYGSPIWFPSSECIDVVVVVDEGMIVCEQREALTFGERKQRGQEVVRVPISDFDGRLTDVHNLHRGHRILSWPGVTDRRVVLKFYGEPLQAAPNFSWACRRALAPQPSSLFEFAKRELEGRRVLWHGNVTPLTTDDEGPSLVPGETTGMVMSVYADCAAVKYLTIPDEFQPDQVVIHVVWRPNGDAIDRLAQVNARIFGNREQLPASQMTRR